MAAASLSDLVVEILHNRGDDEHPDWSVGSGYCVGAQLVPTAARNVDGPGVVFVRVHGTEEHPAQVRLLGDLDGSVAKNIDATRGVCFPASVQLRPLVQTGWR